LTKPETAKCKICSFELLQKSANLKEQKVKDEIFLMRIAEGECENGYLKSEKDFLSFYHICNRVFKWRFLME